MYDRDGRERGESLQGDMYIRDLRNTKGHVSPCTNGAWHPLDRLVGPNGVLWGGACGAGRSCMDCVSPCIKHPLEVVSMMSNKACAIWESGNSCCTYCNLHFMAW